MRVKYRNGRIQIDQKKYLNDVTERFRMKNETVGRTEHAMKNPTKVDQTAAKKIICYLKKNPTLGSIYQADGNTKLIEYVNLDWEDDTSNRKLIATYVFIFAEAAIS